MERSNAIAWACWAGCAAIWGTTWLAIKEGYAAFPPFWAAALRFLIPPRSSSCWPPPSSAAPASPGPR